MNQLKSISAYLSGLLSIFSLPQQKHFLVYLAGLIWIIRFRSMKEIASQLEKKAGDGLHHFIKNSPCESEAIYQGNYHQIKEMGASIHGHKTLILDDTPCPRKGAKIEGSGFHHGADGLVKGLCAVTSLLILGSLRLIWSIQGYRCRKSCPKEDFRSKVEIALEILKSVVFLGWDFTVLMDAWYSCSQLLNFINQQGWVFLGAIKNNRLVWLNGRKTRVRHLAKGRREYKTIKTGKKRRFKIAKVQVYLPKVGEVLLFISKSSDGVRFFITNRLEMTEEEMVELYSQRFWIDVMHQEIKRHLGFGEIFMRSWRGVQKHWACVAIAYNTIALWNSRRCRHRAKTFGEAIKHWRKRISARKIIKLYQNVA